MRAFIFSLDAFVAFTLALLAIYSLIFFSSIPSAYYYLLTQGHYLSRDVLLSLSTTDCGDAYGTCVMNSSILDNIVSQERADLRRNMIYSTVGSMVPDQFGYTMEMSGDQGKSWATLYDTSSASDRVRDDPHAVLSKKLRVATQVMTFGYTGLVYKLQTSPYNYLSCHGDGIVSDGRSGSYGRSSSERYNFGLITCAQITRSVYDGTGYVDVTSNIGNVPSGQIFDINNDIVPSSDVKIVKLTIFI